MLYGGEQSLLLLLANLNRNLFEPIVVTPEGPLAERISRLNIEVFTKKLNRINTKNPFPYLKTVYYLYRLIKKEKIDLIHSNVILCNQYGAVAAKLAGKPIICHVRNILSSKRAFSRTFLGYADVLIANSRATFDGYNKYMRDGQKSYIIHNAVDLRDYSVPTDNKKKFLEKYSIKEDSFIIGIAASIEPKKRQDVYLKAFEKLVKKYPNVITLIIGDTGFPNDIIYLNRLKEFVKERNLKEKVIFTGFVKEIVDLYKVIDLLVLPSIQESFGRVLIEAMAARKPVVASRVGGISEVVEDGVTGFLVTPGNHNDLTSAIEKIISDGKLASKFGEQGEARVKRLFNIEEHVRKVEQIYLEILKLNETTRIS
jgi:glycosyltransferase involved in cell wall biosynthesis